jgi:hypothetical protein
MSDPRRIFMEVRVQWLTDASPEGLERILTLLSDVSKYPTPVQWVQEGLQRGAEPILIENPDGKAPGSVEIRVEGPDQWTVEANSDH